MAGTKYYNFLLDFSGAGSALGGRGFETIPTKQVPEKRAGRLFAVVIGISHYAKGDGEQINDLQYADRDATADARLSEVPGRRRSRRPGRAAAAQRDATTESVRHALFNFLTKPQEQDTVVIYIAGHGAPDPLDPRNLYLMTADSKPDDMGGNGVPYVRSFRTSLSAY